MPGTLDAVDRPAVNAAGAVPLGIGAVVALAAQAQMGTAWRAGIDVSNEDRLVVDGLFHVIRNPFYTGMLVASAGVALMVPNPASLTGFALMLAGCEIDVRLVEEPHPRSVHGAAYSAYERTTPRLVPTLRSLRRGL